MGTSRVRFSADNTSINGRPAKLTSTLRPPAQPVVGQHQCHHCLAHWYETRQQTRIMPAAGSDFRRLARSRDGCLQLGQAARRLDGDAAENRLAAADAAEHAAVPIGFGADSAAVVTLGSGAYSVQVNSVGGAGGAVLVEIYDVP